MSLKRMNALNDVGASTIRKYTYIVCDVLSNGDKFMFTLLMEIHCSTSSSDFMTS